MDPNLSPTTTKPETPPATTKTSPFVKQYSLTWATFITCFLLYINLAYLINGSGVVAFIIAANPVLALLSCCIQWHEKAPEGSEQQMRYRIAIWLLGASLSAGIAYDASIVMPLAVGAILWSLAGISTLGSFYLFFVLPSKGRGDSDAGPKEPLLVCNA